MASELVPPSAELVESGAKAIVLPDFRWLRCDIKSTSLLGNCMLRTLAADQGCVEAILVRDGELAEASVSSPSRTRIASTQPWSAARVRSMQLPKSEVDLMSQRSHRKSGSTIALAPLSRSSAEGVTSSLAMRKTVGLRPSGKAWSRLAAPRVTWR